MDDVTYERTLREQKGWDSVTALEMALEAIKRGELNPRSAIVCIEHEVDDPPSGNVIPAFFASSMDHGQFIAVLEVQKVMAMRRWLGPMWTGIPPTEEEG